MVEIGGVRCCGISCPCTPGTVTRILCCPSATRGEVIKQYFHDYRMRNADFTVDLATGSTTYHPTAQVTDWRVTMSDTGPET